MAEKVAVLRVERDKGFLYFLGDGGVYRVGSRRGPFAGYPKLLVARWSGVRQKGWLYFLDQDGDIARVPMNRKGRGV